MSRKNYNIKCQPECELYNKNESYHHQKCIHLHKMYHDRTETLRYQDNNDFRNKDLFQYHRKRTRSSPRELVINTSVCYLEYNGEKKPDKRIKSNVPTF